MPLVLLVGHCMPDSFALTRVVKAASPEANTKRVNSDAELATHLDGAALLLVNRVLDGRFEASGGIDLIRALRADPGAHAPPMILISNYSDAQAEAEGAGAAPGFGKKELRTVGAERIAAALARGSG